VYTPAGGECDETSNAGCKTVTYDRIGVLAIKGIQELNFKVETGFGAMSVEEIEDFAHAGAITAYLDAIKAEGPRNPVAYIAQKMEDGFSAVGDFVAQRVTAINGYFENLFAKNIQTENLCIVNESGEETCITKDQLDALLESATVEAGARAGNGGGNDGSGNGGAVSSNPEQDAADDSSIEETVTDETAVNTPAETEPLPLEETTLEAEEPVVSEEEAAPEVEASVTEEIVVDEEVTPEADGALEEVVEEVPAADAEEPAAPTTPVTP
jgi:hypothetical protein